MKCAGTRVGFNWTVCFAIKVLSFAFWTGIIFASVIGVALWATKIPSRHAPAAITAASYLLIAIVAAPVCSRHSRRMDSGFLRLLGCTVTIDNLGRGQHLADLRSVKSVISTLELAAEDIEQYAITRVPGWTPLPVVLPAGMACI